jgi:hypothetical protein
MQRALPEAKMRNPATNQAVRYFFKMLFSRNSTCKWNIRGQEIKAVFKYEVTPAK